MVASRYLKQFYDSWMMNYEYALKWKIHDTLRRLGSLEDTFTQVYVYDLKENHHYDHHNTFWDRSSHLNNNSRYDTSNNFMIWYDSLNDEYYQKSYSGRRRSLGSWTVLPSFIFFDLLNILYNLFFKLQDGDIDPPYTTKKINKENVY